jgi:hypothetical protein
MPKILVLLSLMIFILGFSFQGSAQPATSEGCDILNGVDLPALNPTGGILGISRAYFAGDTILATVSPPTANGTPTSVELRVDGNVVDSDSFPGSVTYVFPSDGNFQVDMDLDDGEATWTLTCGQPPQAVPTMSSYGLLLTIVGLLLVASRRFQVSTKRK